MSVNIGSAASSMAEKMLSQLRDMQTDTPKLSAPKADDKDSSGQSFFDHLKNGIKEVDAMQKTADKMGIELSTGKSGNIHETMLAASQAELSFNLMVQMRNKALEAYSEIMRMPV
jgi:flagellar hook-basal body complex protein FliE